MSKESAPKPDYAVARAEIADFARNVVAISGRDGQQSVAVASSAMPRVALVHLREEPEIDELLLPDGASMSIAHPNADYPDLGIYAKNRNLHGVWLRATQWEQSTESAAEVELSFDYVQRQKLAVQTLSAYSSSSQVGGVPTLARDVWAADYAESGYEGHQQELLRTPSPEALLAFISVCRYVYDNR